MKLSIYGGVALVLVSMGQGESRAQEKTSIDAEQTGTRLDVTINRSGLIFDGEMSLRMDVDYVYRASTLLDEPVINCGVRIRNITGTLTVQHEGASHSVTIGPDNSDRINIYHADLLARYAAPGFGYHLACNTGVPAREGMEPFNVASSPSWSATFCDWYRRPSDLPERLGADWCAEGNGRYVGEAAARGIYAEDRAHESAEIEVGSLSINPNDLIVAEIARLRQEAEAKARTEAEAMAAADEKDRIEAERQAALAEAERLRQEERKKAGAADRVKAMLDRVAGVTPDATAKAPGTRDPLAAMAERIAAARAAQEAARAEEAAARARAEADRIAREKEAEETAARLAAEAARKNAEKKTASSTKSPKETQVATTTIDPEVEECYFPRPGFAMSNPATDFVENGPGTVLHKKTNLTWYRCNVGQDFDPVPSSHHVPQCSQPAREFTYNDAVSKVSSLNVSGRNWKIPTRDQLDTILEPGCKGSIFNSRIFNGIVGVRVWTSSFESGKNVAFSDQLYYQSRLFTSNGSTEGGFFNMTSERSKYFILAVSE